MKTIARVFKSRYSVLVGFIVWFVLTSFLLRIGLIFWQIDEISANPVSLVRTFITGLLFDIGSMVLLLLPAFLYFAIVPRKWSGSFVDRIVVWFFTVLGVFVMVLTFFAEITFWEEFRSRFNFIAVDYLIYTHEVVANIRQSYPLPILLGSVAAIALLIVYLIYWMGAFRYTFQERASRMVRLSTLAVICLTALGYMSFVNNTDAEWSPNRYNSEISKAGVYSFFAAMRNNQMKFADFYTTVSDQDAFGLIRRALADSNVVFTADPYSIHRRIMGGHPEKRPNVIFILEESLSASFMTSFGNEEGITPTLDSLAATSLFFANMNATGTRTVRGMEAVTLCIPPTPGQSIVKRPDNQNLFTVSNVFRAKGYPCNFFYGGDGYFDNMNAYFGGNGFAIFDRGRGSILSDEINTTRTNIDDDKVTFENAWGICDEDIFRKMLTVSDAHYKAGKPFFNFVMTTSNHRPYTYPEGRIDIPSGTGRSGAVKYADYSIGMLLREARKKPWFENTIFVIVADHCASSAGKNEIDIKNYHIPALIINSPVRGRIETQCSQIDLFPTLFSLLDWSYESDFFGRNILAADFEPRSFVATYRKLSLMKGNKVMILSDHSKQAFYRYQEASNTLHPVATDKSFLRETVSWYQTADFLFNHHKLK